MLGRFAAANVAKFSADEGALFDELLDIDDVVLTVWLVGVDLSGVASQVKPPVMNPKFENLIDQIKQFHTNQ